MSKYFKRTSDVFFLLLFLYLIFRWGQQFYQNDQLKGQKAKNLTLISLDTSKEILLQKNITPPYILLFWNLNCPPCLVELSRFNQALIDNELPKDKFIPIHLGGGPVEVKSFLKRKDYHFEVYFPANNNEMYPIQGTPTVISVDKNGLIYKSTTGLGLWSVSNAQEIFE